jgi:hypothetical protein
MPNNPPADPRLARRRPTDATLDREAEITEEDVDIAVAAFNKNAPAEARGLLDAEVSDE